QGTNSGDEAKYYRGFQAGVAVPLWFGAQQAKINAAKIETMITGHAYDDYRIQLTARYQSLLSDLQKYEEAIRYYDTTGKILSQKLISNAVKAFQNGEIDFLQYVQLLEQSKNIEMSYLENIMLYDMAVLEANYLMN